MRIIDNNYHEFPNIQILGLPSYLNSSKRLSFSFRDGEDNQEIFAYASLKEEDDKLRILDYENSKPLSYDRFFERIIMIADAWLDSNGKYGFNSLWFSTKDISKEKANLLMEYIDGFEYDNKKSAYIRNIKRSNLLE